jgi:LacI family transcriptional regulator
MLVQGLQQCGKAGKVFAVGSDVFEENLDALRSRILDNIVQKNPYAQGYLGIKALVEYLVQGKAPEQRTIYVGSEVVFRSNAVMYDRDNFRGLLL